MQPITEPALKLFLCSSWIGVGVGVGGGETQRVMLSPRANVSPFRVGVGKLNRDPERERGWRLQGIGALTELTLF